MRSGDRLTRIHSKPGRRLLLTMCLLLACMIALSGCFKHADTKETGKGKDSGSKAVNASPVVSNTAVPTPEAVTAENSQQDGVVTGTFIYPWSDPLYSGIAEVTRLDEHKYHLNVSVVTGFAHNNGSIEGDFTYDGTAFHLAGEDYQDVTLAFTENSITIDYPEDNMFGGNNAEPKGTFYLKNSGVEDAAFLTRLYDELQLPESYRGGFTDVFTYQLNEAKQILLVRSMSSVDRTAIASDELVVYDPTDASFEMVGEVVSYQISELRAKLEELKATPELVYELLRKDAADRFIRVQMDRFDNGDMSARDPDKCVLTNEEAFYIATGIEGKTSVSNNRRDSGNIGSIFITQVDHSDDKKVTIHIYEDVRNDEQDEHTATSDWLEVDRSTGQVTSTLWE